MHIVSQSTPWLLEDCLTTTLHTKCIRRCEAGVVCGATKITVMQRGCVRERVPDISPRVPEVVIIFKETHESPEKTFEMFRLDVRESSVEAWLKSAGQRIAG